MYRYPKLKELRKNKKLSQKTVALLIHGINGNKRLIWNPWNKYSEWTSASSYTASDGTKMSAYRYGIYY